MLWLSPLEASRPLINCRLQAPAKARPERRRDGRLDLLGLPYGEMGKATGVCDACQVSVPTDPQLEQRGDHRVDSVRQLEQRHTGSLSATPACRNASRWLDRASSVSPEAPASSAASSQSRR